MAADLKEHLKGLPEYCRLVPLGLSVKDEVTGKWEINPKAPLKPPNGKKWIDWPYSLEEVCKIKKTGVGCLHGVKGNGLVFIDPDGEDAPESFEDKIGRSIKDLPKTVTWTSGTPGRYQLVLRVPEQWWGVVDQIDLQKDNCSKCQILWTGQSVIAGLHDSGRQYQWLTGRSPAQVDIAVAPEWFLEKWAELSAPKVPPKANLFKFRRSYEKGVNDSSRVESHLERYLTPQDNNEDFEYPRKAWLDIGMALHHLSWELGDDWMHYEHWRDWSALQSNFKGDDDCYKTWASFKGRNDGITIDTFFGHYCKKSPQGLIDFPDKEEQVEQKDPVQEIAEIVEELYQLEKSNGSWNKRHYLRSRLYGRRIPKEEVDKRLFELFAEEHGLPLGNHGGERKHRTLGSQLAPNEELKPQLKGFTLAGRDHVIYGPAGAGKTTFALALSYAVFTGHNNLFDKEDGVSIENQGATLWCGSDGEDGALGMAQAYIKKLKPPKQAEWEKHTTFWGANKDTGEPPWGFTISNLHELMNQLERGHPTGVPYRLLALDSLKKILELAGIDFGIGPVGTVMRLMQAIAARFNVALIWIHHPKPGASVANMGIDAAGGNSNIVQIPYAIINLRKKEHKELGQYAEVEIQKLRGEQSRKFNITMDENYGLYKLVPPAEAEDRTTLILEQIWIRQDSGASTQEITEGIDGGVKNTIANNLTAIRNQKLVENTRKRWYLTKAGCKRLQVDMTTYQDEIKEYLEGQGKSIR